MGDGPTQESFVNMSKYTFKELNTSWFRRMEKNDSLDHCSCLSVLIRRHVSLRFIAPVILEKQNTLPVYSQKVANSKKL